MSDQQVVGLAWLTGLVLVALVVTGALVGSVSAADDLRSRAERALSDAGLDGIGVDFDGREARLTGTATTNLDRAELVVAGIDGVRSVDVRALKVARPTAAPVDTPTLTLRRTTGGVAISGTVPDADVAADIKARAAEVLAAPVTGDLMIDAGVGTADWLSRMPVVLGEVVAIHGLGLRIDGSGTIELAGSIENGAGVDRVGSLVSSAVPGLSLVNRLRVAPGGLSAEDAAVLNSTMLDLGPGTSALGPDDRRALDRVADVLQRNVKVVIEVRAHADQDDRLEKARLSAVEAYLVQAGVATDRVTTAGHAPARKPRVDFVVKEK